jgi:dCTP deaminase
MTGGRNPLFDNGIFDGVLISDRDIRAEIDSERIVLDPYEAAMVQPSSVDVRIDRYFRLFDNHKYAHIDPAEEQPELTRLVEVEEGEPVHPAPRRIRARLHLRNRHAAGRHRRAP